MCTDLLFITPNRKTRQCTVDSLSKGTAEEDGRRSNDGYQKLEVMHLGLPVVRSEDLIAITQ